MLKYLSIGLVRSLTSKNIYRSFIHQNTFLNTRLELFRHFNILNVSNIHYVFQRKVLHLLMSDKFLPNISFWYYNTIIRFLEKCNAKKVFLKFNPFIENNLSYVDLTRCNLWYPRLVLFNRTFKHKFLLKESLKVLHLALRYKDPTFFANWIRNLLTRVDFWKYKTVFRYIKYVLKNLFFIHFPELKLKGFSLQWAGKVGVVGNARTRNLSYQIGNTSNTSYTNKIKYDLSFIKTFTGVIGFKVWLYF